LDAGSWYPGTSNPKIVARTSHGDAKEVPKHQIGGDRDEYGDDPYSNSNSSCAG